MKITMEGYLSANLTLDEAYLDGADLEKLLANVLKGLASLHASRYRATITIEPLTLVE